MNIVLIMRLNLFIVQNAIVRFSSTTENWQLCHNGGWYEAIFLSHVRNGFLYDKVCLNRGKTIFKCVKNEDKHLKIVQFVNGHGLNNEIWYWYSWNIYLPYTVFKMRLNPFLVCQMRQIIIHALELLIAWYWWEIWRFFVFSQVHNEIFHNMRC